MTTSPGGAADPPLAGVAAAFLRAWDRRSAAERTTFLSSLGGTTRDTDVAALRTVRERAALCGAVAPRDLVRDHPDEVGLRLLDLSAPDFDRTRTPDGWRWTLRSGARHEALTRLVTDGRVQDTLEAVVPLSTDPAGGILQEIAARRVSGDPSTPSIAADTPAAVQALSWARPLGGVAADLAELRRRSAVAALWSGYEVLLAHGVIGRDTELADLRAFADAPVDASPAAVPVASVVGIGGAGKSTVIADLIRPYHESLAEPAADAPIVVVVDFDRVRFRGEAQLELSYELTRQIGWAVPEAGADFAVLRYQLRKQRDEGSVDTYSGHSVPEDDVHDSSAFETEAATIVALHGLGDRPVLLVLDTFEEWQSRRIDPYWPDRTGWNDPETRVWEWVAALRDRMGLRGLRVLVSGRADATFSGRSGTADLAVSLDDLARPDAEALLRAMGVPDYACGPLAEQVGGNPLELRVGSRYLLRLPAGERAAFLSGEPGGVGALDAELRSSVLYDRFLQHLPDDLRALAHPGLVLRRVTPALVREVLAPHCGLGDVSTAEAEALTDRLADQVWLVKRTDDGLTHQPNMRRRMLRLMAADAAHADTVRAIHAAAADWYARELDGSPGSPAETEWFYHSLMFDPDGWRSRLADRADRTRWSALAVGLGSSVEELPPGLREPVHFLRNDELTVADGIGLPPVLAREWFVRRGDELVKRGRATEAVVLFDVVRARPEIGVENPPWLAQAFCEAGLWSRYWAATEPPGVGPAVDVLPRAGRYAALDALCSDDPDHWPTFCRGLAHVVARSVTPSDLLVEQAFLELLSATVASGTPQHGTPPATLESVRRVGAGEAEGGADLFPVDQFRHLQVWLAAGPTRPFTLTRLAGLLRPDPEWVAQFGVLVGLRASWLDGYLHDLRDLARRARQGTSMPTVHTLLGETILRFVRRTGDRIEVAPGAIRAGITALPVLRGDNPELRPAVARALGQAVGPAGPSMLAALAQSVLPIPVADLRPEALPAGGDPRVSAVLTQLVHIVDRSGVLLPFLAAAADRLPDATSLHEALHAVRRWDNAQERLLAALAAPAR